MWEQAVFSIDKHCMAMALQICPSYRRLLRHRRHHAHGVAAVPVAAPPRSPLRISQRFIETPREMI